MVEKMENRILESIAKHITTKHIYIDRKHGKQKTSKFFTMFLLVLTNNWRKNCKDKERNKRQTEKQKVS